MALYASYALLTIFIADGSRFEAGVSADTGAIEHNMRKTRTSLDIVKCLI